ncbi:aminomethyltransferase [Sphingomonas sp. Root710]|uniref:DUF1989 domain-containing protein n=1 Tax=Sphingomonas sp. Root710 TaxID=1736594 RepID=UPI0006F81AFF|nr:urea carboxylase-associated family protein [Sphingomonas sp. Root710]KRB83139.1 aminomethyltransferase [Sphingomonas sp. Root710]
MSTTDFETIPARRGMAARMKAGQLLRVRNTHGAQIVDTWAFNADDLTEFMSMEHSRAHILKYIPAIGDMMLTNRRRPCLTFLEDTAGGVHDTLIAACDRYRFELLGCEEYHDNCTDNLHAGLKALGIGVAETPSPLNLFMNIPIAADRSLSFDPPVSTPGSHVLLRAEMDLIVAFSACPQDILPINGVACTPTEAHFRIENA